MSDFKASIIVPARNESTYINVFLERLIENLKSPAEILIVVDNKEDSTFSTLKNFDNSKIKVIKLISSYGPGPANAIRYGIDSASTGIVVITMADGSDDPRDIDDLILLIERGCSIAVASRYMPGGQQVGGPRIKRWLSRVAGKSFALITGVGTRDATNSFKAYDKNFVNQVGIHSRHGFEIGLELTAKARRLGLSVAEIPTTWIDRTYGQSNFRLAKWLPRYLGWYLFGLGFVHPDSTIRALIKSRETKS